MKPLTIKSLLVLRNSTLVLSLLIIAMTTLLGFMLTNPEIKYLAFLSIKIFASSAILAVLHYYASNGLNSSLN